MSTWTLVALIARNPSVSCKQETETKVGMCRITERRSVVKSALLSSDNFSAKVSSTWLGATRVFKATLTCPESSAVACVTTATRSAVCQLYVGAGRKGTIRLAKWRSFQSAERWFVSQEFAFISRSGRDKLHGGNHCGGENWSPSTPRRTISQ